VITVEITGRNITVQDMTTEEMIMRKYPIAADTIMTIIMDITKIMDMGIMVTNTTTAMTTNCN